jgi:hypothetical protein
MKLICTAICLVGLATSLGAQTTRTETKSKVSVKSGDSVRVTGCVEPRADGSGFMLTNVADKTGALHNYILVSDDGDLPKHVGHRVQISGRVTDRGDGKVKTETTTKTKVEHGDDRETTRKSEFKGDASVLPYLGVSSLKMIAAVCP